MRPPLKQVVGDDIQKNTERYEPQDHPKWARKVDKLWGTGWHKQLSICAEYAGRGTGQGVVLRSSRSESTALGFIYGCLQSFHLQLM